MNGQMIIRSKVKDGAMHIVYYCIIRQGFFNGQVITKVYVQSPKQMVYYFSKSRVPPLPHDKERFPSWRTFA
jgi:hypothetical protein